MKKILYFLVFMPFIVFGQNTDLNYIKTTSYKQEVNTPVENPEITVANVQITYIDGLGRPVQQIAHQQASNGNDIVTPMDYDQFGRQPKEYLPYVPTAAPSLFFVDSAIDDAFEFYNTLNYGNTLNAYSEKLFENSPLNRVMKQAAPGNDWVMPSVPSAPDHTVKMKYETNIDPEVKMFMANAEWSSAFGLYDISLDNNVGGSTFYKIRQLYKTVTFDENTDGSLNETNGSTVEFKDKEGKVILKRTYNITPNNNTETYDTYYVYDQYGNLTYVIPPKADGAITPEILDNLCYQYKYDYRNRLVEKKLPGKQWEFIVYDKLDRVVATGPAFSPFSDLGSVGWMITKYDVFNRPIVTGWMPVATPGGIIDNAARQSLQEQVSNQISGFSENKITTGDNTNIFEVSYRYTNNVFPTSSFYVLTVNYYDDYDFPDAPTDFSDIENQPVYYNNATKPKGLPTGSWVRVLEASYNINAETSYTLYDYKARPIKSYKRNYLRGYTNVLSKLDFSGKKLYTITYHKRDSGSLEIKVEEQFVYSPQDRLVYHFHIINDGVAEVLANNEYDELGQLIVKKVGGQNVVNLDNYQTINYKYNIRGWLTSINNPDDPQENNDNDLFAFKLNYNEPIPNASFGVVPLYNGNISATYWNNTSDANERKYEYAYDQLNRLTAAVFKNISYGNTNNPQENYYGESMSYDKNGNIIQLNRNGTTEDPLIGAREIDNLNYFYPDNSNQLSKVTDISLDTNGFKDDTDQNSQDLVDDYEYDANGNMKKDQNKGIYDNIIYNHLNLPTRINFAGLGNISYIYNALGQKVKKTVEEVTIANTTDYLDGYQYLNAKLKFFPTTEGYVNAYQDTGIIQQGSYLFNYVYSYKDNLGNVRLSYAKDPRTNTLKILEQNHYYPFGLKHENYSSERRVFAKDYPYDEYIEVATDQNVRMKIVPGGGGPVVYGERNYKYNGKEFQNELGLNMYDYGWRNYMPDLGRWTQIDPLFNDLKFAHDTNQVDKNDREEVYMSIINDLELGGGIYNPDNLNPYGYGYNNPVSFDDPDGRCPSCLIGAAIGAAVEYGSQVAVNLAKGQSLKSSLGNVDIGKIAIATVTGALTGGLSSIKVIGAAAKVYKAVAMSATVGAGEIAQQAYENGTNKPISAGKLAVEIVADKAVPAVIKVLGKTVSTVEKTAVSRSVTKKEIANKIKKEAVNAAATQAVKEPVKNKLQ